VRGTPLLALSSQLSSSEFELANRALEGHATALLLRSGISPSCHSRVRPSTLLNSRRSNSQPCDTLIVLKLTAKFASMLVLIALGAPVMACLIPGAVLTHAERECCRHIAGQCGSMSMPSSMPSSHSCCKAQVRASNAYLKAPSISAPALLLGGSLAALAVELPANSQRRGPAVDHPPPAPFDRPNVLRI